LFYGICIKEVFFLLLNLVEHHFDSISNLNAKKSKIGEMKSKISAKY